MEGGDLSAGASDENPSEVEFLLEREEGLEEQRSPYFPDDMEDSESLEFERLFAPRSRAGARGLCSGSAWALAFFGVDCFDPEVMDYVANLGMHTSSPSLDVKAEELQQQLIIETRNLKKTRNFYQRLIQQERKNKGSETKLMLSKLKSQLDELRSKVTFLDCVKKYLEVLSVDRWGLEVSLLPSLAVSGRDSCELQSSDNPSALSFSVSKGKSTLQAGSRLGLMAYLYARNAAVEGYIQQFLYTYRFFCTPEQFLQFIMEKFSSEETQKVEDWFIDGSKIFHRSLDLLQLWVTDCRSVDFRQRSLVEAVENFLNTEVVPAYSQGEALLHALHTCHASSTDTQRKGSSTGLDEDDSVCLHSSLEDLCRKWRIPRLVESSASTPKQKAFSISAALPMPCHGSVMSSLCLQSEEQVPFSQNEYSAQHIAQQLTLLQQEMFQGCHPVHFLNSRIQGVRDKVLSPNKNVSQPIPAAGGRGVLVQEGAADTFLQRLLTHADSVTNWISAEIVICDSVKSQAALLTKYLWIGKHCYKWRNFATAMQVLGALENVIVRQLPAWKHLTSKVLEILEELRAVQVFLKSDDLCLMGGQRTQRRPTLPSAHILAMHVQQLEIGAFTLTTGAYKWNKLRSIAKVVSQVHAFQETLYPYKPDRDLQAYLHSRITRLANSDIHLLAADNDANFQQSSERQTRRIHNTLKRVKATFQ
uniref:Uncharacterized protein n=1 Tax=Oryzias sinensis TaxID=183150 RepID=A0A8C7XLQ3_9TELE